MAINELGIAEFRQNLQEWREALQNDQAISSSSEEYPEAVALVEAMERLEKELEKKKSQELISDFLLVISFMNAVSEADEDYDLDEEDEIDEEE